MSTQFLICFSFNMVVLGSCLFLEYSSGNLKLGVYCYILDLGGDGNFVTGRDCENYPNDLMDTASRMPIFVA